MSDAPAFTTRWPVPTRWADNDHYGHVNNVAYYSYFDTAVNAWLMSETGMDTRELQAIGVVAETSCRYLRQLSFPDQLEVGIACERLGERSVVYRLAVFTAGDDEPAALGRFAHVYVDAVTRTPVPVPEPVRQAVRRLGS
ncbi:thioesterase superfamily protein [Segniliparus rotundus DSM 44985]|uniref:Thioesterase superfamily protein n=1 Tax=Segniliparus rotundus (strain ATCC BAA-972 / CDC 1076 / CIP 108378 / DSM 44985 / JCM 13578) TaxID=640132 RepID=D6ZBY1_SEGRD|nr:thioesterase family protein [Segniliparus rotundus]ADG96958.1 thioesterase superfamily protein [Segniliparus rotundus DSM 44985]